MNSLSSTIKDSIPVQSLKQLQDLGIETIVAIPGVPSTSQAPNHEYNYEHFMYDNRQILTPVQKDQVLRTNGMWHKELTSSGNNIIIFKQYKTIACKLCQARFRVYKI